MYLVKKTTNYREDTNSDCVQERKLEKWKLCGCQESEGVDLCLLRWKKENHIQTKVQTRLHLPYQFLEIFIIFFV